MHWLLEWAAFPLRALAPVFDVGRNMGTNSPATLRGAYEAYAAAPPNVAQLAPTSSRPQVGGAMDTIVAAARAARGLSHDPVVRIGCALFDDQLRVVMTGRNGTTRGTHGIDGVDLKLDKDAWMLHAERHALCECARRGIATAGLRAYLTAFPTAEGARALVSAGIGEVHAAPNAYRSAERAAHYEPKTAIARDILRLGGVVVVDDAPRDSNAAADAGPRADEAALVESYYVVVPAQISQGDDASSTSEDGATARRQPSTGAPGALVIETARTCRERSRDPNTHVACVLFLDDDVVTAAACNDFTRGVDPTPERCARPTKYEWIEHAERAALWDCAARGVRTAGLRAYCAAFPCAQCALALVAAGITQVHASLNEYRSADDAARWEASCAAALEILKAGGVTVVHALPRMR